MTSCDQNYVLDDGNSMLSNWWIWPKKKKKKIRTFNSFINRNVCSYGWKM